MNRPGISDGAVENAARCLRTILLVTLPRLLTTANQQLNHRLKLFLSGYTQAAQAQ